MKRAVHAAVWALALTSSADLRADVYSRSYGPKGIVYVAQPTLRWQVWGVKGTELSKAWIKLDGQTLPASYDSGGRVATWRPNGNWQPGTYAVEMGVTTEDGMTVRKNWKIEVRRPPAIAESESNGNAAMPYVNAFRASLGLPHAYAIPELERAALAHALYLSRNNRTGHYQSESEPLFTGATPAERLNSFGYVGGSMEVVHFGREKVAEAVDSLVAAPYHRFAFMQPGRIPLGAAFHDKRLVIDFGEGEGEATLAHPYDGQSNVPTAWRGQERPNPLRFYNDIAPYPGYPIVLGHFSPSPVRLRIAKAEVFVALTGQRVNVGVNHPDNDEHLTDAVILIPKSPLQPQTEYRVIVSGQVENGPRIEKSWKFRTGS